jgi:hypothetical protein
MLLQNSQFDAARKHAEFQLFGARGLFRLRFVRRPNGYKGFTVVYDECAMLGCKQSML